MTTLYLAGAKKHRQLRARKGDLQRSFPLDVPMVPSSSIAMTADSVHLICGGFSLGKTIRFGSL
jgi:hypothetical protein